VEWLRAEESRRPDALFVDPYAAAFVAGAQRSLEAGTDTRERLRTVGALFYLHVVIRTKFYDDYLLAAAAEGLPSGGAAGCGPGRQGVPAGLARRGPPVRGTCHRPTPRDARPGLRRGAGTSHGHPRPR
jgi:hypothetical protein